MLPAALVGLAVVHGLVTLLGAEEPAIVVHATCPETVATATDQTSANEAEAPDPFAALYGMGMVPVTTAVEGRVDDYTAVSFEARLDGGPAPCDGEYCHAGCFRAFAVALDPGLADIALEVTPIADPEDVIGASIEPGRSVSAGFCHSFSEGTPPTFDVRIVARARDGEGRIAVQGWLERVPDTMRNDEAPPPTTGEEIPVGAGTAPEANIVRFMASDPHVPLAEVWIGKLRAAPQGSCVRWPNKPQDWVALDAWGQRVGTQRRTAAEFYDVTGCYEMTTERIDGSDGSGLLASIGYEPAPSVRIVPTIAQREAFATFLADMDALWPPGETAREPLFFRGYDGVPSVAVGGRALMIAAYVDGEWQPRHTETLYSAEPMIPDPYRVLGVFDLDLDGTAEVVFRESEGPAWDDAVLRPIGSMWERVATSVGGGTI